MVKGVALSGGRVRDLSEDDLLAVLRKHLPSAGGVIVPSGDDSAVLSFPDGRVSVSTDMLVEDVHFRRGWSTGEDVGWRAAMQNLADAVAMGAVPISLVVSLELPGDLPVAWVEGLARGMAAACAVCGTGVDGGDLVGGDRVAISVTVLGALEGRDPVLRSAARSGEPLIHAGVLGRAAAGMALLEHGYTRRQVTFPDEESLLVDDFLRPKPPLRRALAACREGAIGAFMDVSDGLLRDARRMAEASGVWLDIESTRLADSIHPLIGIGRRMGMADPWQWALETALSGGEDHGFLGTLRVHAERAWGLNTPTLPAGFTRIGTVREAHDGGLVTVDGREIALAGGWDHFGGA